MIGKTLAHYEIGSLLGKGGMGEVYRARDTKLNRDVALKIIPEIYASDAQRMGRFQREAQLLASLNHPNIASIYGLEEDGGIRALVLELVEGEDLSEKLETRTLALDEALDIAVQIARALETAHEKGVIHRDLKPANVKVTPDGKVKVLDFGLAKALAGDNEGDGAQLSQSMSPTMTAAATSAGMILGTAAYMSPEQARGKTVDRRADIWAFGIVLFEMLARKQLFAGETISDTLAAVIKDDPDWSLIPTDTPQLVLDLMRRCLEKDRQRRLQSIGEARIALEDLRQAQGSGASILTMAPAAATSGMATTDSLPDEANAKLSGRSRLIWAISLVVVAGLTGLVTTMLGPESTEPGARKFHLDPEGLQVSYPTQPALSPDGRHIAYFADSGINIRDLSVLDAVKIPGTDTATSPFWSPDGAWLAFGQAGRIYKVAAGGGTPVAVCDVPFGTLDGATWGDDDVMVLAPNAGPLYRVSSSGGDPKVLFPAEVGESDFHTPSVLPGGRAVIFTTHNNSGRETLEIFADGERRVLLKIPGARLEYAVWAPSRNSASRGHLVYHRLNTNTGVWAVPFDLDALELAGEPFILDPDGTFPSIARDGSMLHATGSGGGLKQLVVVDRKGEEISTIGQPQSDTAYPALSPDGRWVLVSAREADDRDIWAHDIERGTRTRITFGAGQDARQAIWINNGVDIAYTTGSAQTNTIYLRPADGSGEPEFLVEGYQLSIPDGTETMSFVRFVADTGNDIYIYPMDGSAETQPFLQTGAAEFGPQISPNGKYIVYVSDESGGLEIYLKSFPSGDGKWQVSTAGGTWPVWSRAGDEIIYRQGSGATASMMSVPVQTDPTVRLGNPVAMFTAADAPNLDYSTGFRGFNVTDDPDRFLMLRLEGDSRSRAARLVYSENWFESYRRGAR